MLVFVQMMFHNFTVLGLIAVLSNGYRIVCHCFLWRRQFLLKVCLCKAMSWVPTEFDDRRIQVLRESRPIDSGFLARQSPAGLRARQTPCRALPFFPRKKSDRDQWLGAIKDQAS